MSLSIADLPPLVVGGAVFNEQYNSSPRSMPVSAILEEAFAQGFNAIDTLPYYGPLEEIFGQALSEISPKWSREQYMICTKAGRIRLDEFDYSRAAIRRSVERSLARLHTRYLDVVYLHDIEFVPQAQVLEAAKELRALKNEGLVRYIGVSGYPVAFLYRVALACKHDAAIGALDVVMSYSNGCIQNEILFDYYPKFINECGLQKVLNGSILSMSLLRSSLTHAFHPAAPALKARVARVAQALQRRGIELADVATRFAYKKWLFEGSQWNTRCLIVLGVSSVDELRAAIDNYKLVQSRVREAEDTELFDQVRRELGEHHNETWASGLEENQ
jgi:D-arabinose 1-dehydrogenase